MTGHTPEDIQTWKQTYGEVYEVAIEDKRAYFRTPDRVTLGYAMQKGQQNPMAALEVIAKNCFLGGDAILLEQDAYFLSLSKVLGDLMKIKEAKLKKL